MSSDAREPIDREEHLARLVRSVCEPLDVTVTHFETALPDLVTVGWLQPMNQGWVILVNPSISLAAAEQTVLHEAGHLLLCHGESSEYQEALKLDAEARTDHHRGPWEVEADAMAVALAEFTDRLQTTVAEVLEESAKDASHFP